MRAARFTPLAAACALAVVEPAWADLLPPLPPPPDPTATIDQVTGTVGGLLGSPSSGDPGGTTGGGGTSGGSGGGTPTTTGDADQTSTGADGGGSAPPTAADTRAPRVRFLILSSLHEIARTGRIKVRLTCDEPAVVSLTGAVRSGHPRKVVRLRQTLLGYRAPGSQKVTIAKPRAAHRALSRARTLRVSLESIAVDTARNRATGTYKRTLHRMRKVAHLRRTARTAAWGPVHTR